MRKTKRVAAFQTSLLGPPKAPDWEQWAIRDFWTAREFAELAAFDLGSLDLQRHGQRDDLLALANKSIQEKKLRFHPTPSEWLKWAIDRGIRVPADLQKAVNARKSQKVPDETTDMTIDDGSRTASGRTIERRTMVRLIGGMAIAYYGSLEKPYVPATAISKDLLAKGITIDVDTVAKYLMEAAKLFEQKGLPKL